MTTIRTTCEGCGDVELATADIKLELSCEGGEGFYVFACQRCALTQRRPANRRAVSILLACGVVYEVARGLMTEEEVESFVVDLADADEAEFWEDLLSGSWR